MNGFYLYSITMMMIRQVYWWWKSYCTKSFPSARPSHKRWSLWKWSCIYVIMSFQNFNWANVCITNTQFDQITCWNFLMDMVYECVFDVFFFFYFILLFFFFEFSLHKSCSTKCLCSCTWNRFLTIDWNGLHANSMNIYRFVFRKTVKKKNVIRAK